MFDFYLLLIIFGCFSGFTAGFFGVGGGAILVPILSLLFKKYGFFGEYYLHSSLATSLAIMIFTSTSSIYAQQKRKNIDWEIVKNMIIGIIPGTIAGAFIAPLINSQLLTIFFTLFLFYISYRLLNKPKILKAKVETETGVVNKQVNLVFIKSFVIGIISALLGIGGGTLTVPLLFNLGKKLKQAVAISSACGFFIAISGSLGYIFSSFQVNLEQAQAIGFIHLPSVAIISIFSMSFAPIGVKFINTISEQLSKKIFAIFLIIISLKMLYNLIF